VTKESSEKSKIQRIYELAVRVVASMKLGGEAANPAELDLWVALADRTKKVLDRRESLYSATAFRASDPQFELSPYVGESIRRIRPRNGEDAGSN